MTGNQDYLKLLEEKKSLHIQKAMDYGVRGGDPLANLRASSELGVPPWKACIIRASDKWQRIKSFMLNGSLANESLEDSLKDMSAYLDLALVLKREEDARGPIEQTAIREKKAKHIEDYHRKLTLVPQE